MKSVFRLIRGRRKEFVVPLSPKTDLVWRVVRDGSAFKAGDIVCAKKPIPIGEAASRVASWRTKVTGEELALLRSAEGSTHVDPLGSDPYKELLQFLPPDPDPGPKPAA